jgi:uncharacterized MnhB-related membrane protein
MNWNFIIALVVLVTLGISAIFYLLEALTLAVILASVLSALSAAVFAAFLAKSGKLY